MYLKATESQLLFMIMRIDFMAKIRCNRILQSYRNLGLVLNDTCLSLSICFYTGLIVCLVIFSDNKAYKTFLDFFQV